MGIDCERESQSLLVRLRGDLRRCGKSVDREASQGQCHLEFWRGKRWGQRLILESVCVFWRCKVCVDLGGRGLGRKEDNLSLRTYLWMGGRGHEKAQKLPDAGKYLGTHEWRKLAMRVEKRARDAQGVRK